MLSAGLIWIFWQASQLPMQSRAKARARALKFSAQAGSASARLIRIALTGLPVRIDLWPRLADSSASVLVEHFSRASVQSRISG